MTTISFAGAERGAAYTARPRSDEHVYRRALRHSRRVRFLRVGLLAVIATVLLGLVAKNYLPSFGMIRIPGEIGKLVIRGTKVTMQGPHLTGYNDSRPYEFTADTATQDITKPDLVELQRIRAKMAMADQSTVHLWADAGLYNMKTDMLQLNDNIRLTSSTGYEARLKQALVDMDKGTVVSDTPVWVKMLDGFLNAKHLDIADKGELLRFTDVTMVLQPKQDAKASQP